MSNLLSHYYILSAEAVRNIREASNRLQDIINKQFNQGKLNQQDYLKAVNNLHSIKRQEYHSVQYKRVDDETKR
ncbi:MAG: hypothetical protein ACTHLE_13520 [Agriterribacter sp.]